MCCSVLVNSALWDNDDVIVKLNALCFILNSLCQAIMAEGKDHALGVGITKMSSTKMCVAV